MAWTFYRRAWTSQNRPAVRHRPGRLRGWWAPLVSPASTCDEFCKVLGSSKPSQAGPTAFSGGRSLRRFVGSRRVWASKSQWRAPPLHTQWQTFCRVLPGAPAHRSQALANKACRCSCVRSPALPLSTKCTGGDGFSSDGRLQEQESLWQQFFLDPTMWWDNRRDKKSSRSPDFRRKGSGEVLWLNSMCKPAWVDEQLVSLYGASPSKGSSPDKPEPGRRAGSEMGVVTAGTVSMLCQQGKLSEAVGALECLAQTDCAISQSLFYTVLKLCTAKKDLVVGRRVHDLSVKLGYESNAYLGNHILRMYARGGRLQEAMDVFTRVGKPDVFMWFSIISAYAKHGKPDEAIQLYNEMRTSGVKADAHVFVAALQACAFAADVESGRKVHCDVLKSGIPLNLFIGNCLVDMYAKCGLLKDACQVFESLAQKDVVTWTALISGYAQQGPGQEALVVYERMEREGLIVADHVTFACLLKACASAGDLQKGRHLHSLIVERGQLHNVLVGNCLVDMYAKCGELEKAHQVFESLVLKDVVTWTSLIAGYAQQGLGPEALVVYRQMEQEGLAVANHVTFACLLKACASTGDLQMGRHLHSQIVERKLLDNILVGSCLVDMYAKCGELKDAHQIFESLPTKDVVTWTALIAGYAQQGLGEEALAVYQHMEQEGLIVADDVTFACLLKACASTGALQKGRHLHSQIVERGPLDNTLLGNCLVDMYAKCGELEDARQVFDSLATKDVVTWNFLIAGYAQQGLGQEALVLFGQMEQDDLILANHVTFACLLKACANNGALQKGRQLHSQIVERRLLDDIVLGNCLVDMYAKCGELEDARWVFDSLATKNVVTWNALISAYGTCDDGHSALACFEEMLVAGIQPNDTTFTCLLVACSHAGLVHEGRKHFDSMAEQHGIKPTLEHYNCMIDLLGRAGHLDEAEKMMLSCEGQSNVVGLTSLLNACKIHGDIERAMWCFESIVRLDPQRASAYVLMANAYADAGRWADVDRIETQRMVAGANKKPAVATVEVNEQVHRFLVGERRDDLALKVESTNARLKEEGGHVPHTKLVLKPLCEKEKEDALCGHAEKLALAFGLLNTPSGTPLVVTKNLRMCSDCHSSTEIMSRVEKREIVVRDGYRVHRFAAGACSCHGR